jgi:hypothetical protein
VFLKTTLTFIISDNQRNIEIRESLKFTDTVEEKIGYQQNWKQSFGKKM